MLLKGIQVSDFAAVLTVLYFCRQKTKDIEVDLWRFDVANRRPGIGDSKCQKQSE